MSDTWTSNPSEHDQAYLRVSTYFILKRGRGTSLSSADSDALESWIRDGYSWMDVLSAIDVAFAKSRTAPASVRACKRYLPKNELSDELLDPAILAAAFGGAIAPSPAPNLREDRDARDQDTSGDPLTDAARTHLRHEADTHPDPIAQQAYLALLQEIDERCQHGALAPETIALFDEALALIAFDLLPPADQQRIQAHVDTAPPTLRTRTLLEHVGHALQLCYPHAGTLPPRPTP